MPLAKQKRIPTTFEYVILIVIAVVFAIGAGFVMESLSNVSYKISERNAMVYWNEARIGIWRYHSTPRGTFLTIRNNEPFVIRLTSISLNNATLQINASPLSTGESISLIHPVRCSPGAYSYKTTIAYVDAEHNVPREFVGVVPLIGACRV